MDRKYIFPITKDFDYFDVDNFRTKKLEGTVELRKACLPGADAFLISPKLYIRFKKDGKFDNGFEKELKPCVKNLVDKFSRITIRTCFRFSGYENPRSLPAFRDLISIKEVINGIKDAYKAGEDFAEENKIDWFELGLIMMGRVEAERSGIIIVDPEKSNLCVVESCWGDNHLIATGEEGFDSFWVDKSGKILRKDIREKKKGYYFVKGDRVKRAIERDKKEKSCLSYKEITKIAKNSFKAADYHKTSVEIEYMVREDGFIDMYELQERPGLHLSLPKKDDGRDKSLVSGVAVNGGKVEGVVKVVSSLKEIKEVKPGVVLVLPSKMMGEDIPIIGKISALITDTGGITAHISTIAKESDIPCIVGAKDASKKLKDGMKVVVDAANGKVYDSSFGDSVRVIKKSNEVVWIDNLKAEMDLVGAKAFNLVRLMQIGVNVPDAYVITTEAFEKFLKQNGIEKEMRKKYKKIDVENLEEIGEVIKKKILNGEVSKKLESDILKSFLVLKEKYGEVSVRSSATCEDSIKASFAGQFQSFLFIDDKEKLIESIKKCWASLYRSGAVLYSIQKGIDILKVKMGVVVQGMINAEVAGVIFTEDLKNEDGNMLIEVAKGIGENVVSGEVTPVSYTVKKKTGRIIKKVGEEDELISKSKVLYLASIGKKIEEYFGLAQDIEWAIEKDKIYILQSRPITTQK